MENFHLKIENAGNEIIIREGQALPPVPPKKILITGDIATVATFVNNRKHVTEGAGSQYINPERAVVEVDIEKKTITLSLDPEDANGAVVISKLEPNPDLTQFGINKNIQFSQKELVKLLKFSRLYFEDFGKHGELLKAYQAFTAKTYTDLAGEQDNRGNKNFAFNKKVETGLPTSFIMNVPVFKGQEKKRFMVEICLDVTDAAASFWFESVELEEISDIESGQIIDEQLEACKDYVIVYK